MDDTSGLQVNRMMLDIADLHAPSDDKAYWLSRSAAERLEAVETMRRILYGYDPAAERLQRLLEVVACPPR